MSKANPRLYNKASKHSNKAGRANEADEAEATKAGSRPESPIIAPLCAGQQRTTNLTLAFAAHARLLANTPAKGEDKANMASPQSTVARLHREIEGALARRFAGALTPLTKSQPDRTPTGIQAIDLLLGGGVPIGSLSELVGLESSGRMTFALSLLATITGEDTAAAWVDVSDAFDPESAAQAGVDLRRLLWVRCAEPPEARPSSGPQRSVQSDSHSALQQPVSPLVPRGGGSPHPRYEAHGMSQAVASLLQSQPRSAAMPGRRERCVVGTPGAPNRPLKPFWGASPHREEQVPSDRMPARRSVAEAKAREVAAPAVQTDGKPAQPYCLPVPAPSRHLVRARAQSWAAVDRALRATDLLLQAGGFSLLVLDCGSVPAEMTWRIPLSTWFRFRTACERTRTTLVLLTQHPCAKASADMVVRMHAGEMQLQGGVLTGIHFAAELERERTRTTFSNVVPIRKPPHAERDGRWNGHTAWAVHS